MTPQSRIGMVHFLVASFTDRNTDFMTASSVGKESLFLVYFLIFPFRFSMIFMV